MTLDRFNAAPPTPAARPMAPPAVRPMAPARQDDGPRGPRTDLPAIGGDRRTNPALAFEGPEGLDDLSMDSPFDPMEGMSPGPRGQAQLADHARQMGMTADELLVMAETTGIPAKLLTETFAAKGEVNPTVKRVMTEKLGGDEEARRKLLAMPADEFQAFTGKLRDDSMTTGLAMPQVHAVREGHAMPEAIQADMAERMGVSGDELAKLQKGGKLDDLVDKAVKEQKTMAAVVAAGPPSRDWRGSPAPASDAPDPGVSPSGEFSALDPVHKDRIGEAKDHIIRLFEQGRVEDAKAFIAAGADSKYVKEHGTTNMAAAQRAFIELERRGYDTDVVRRGLSWNYGIKDEGLENAATRFPQ